jgi:hypothetical protein
MMGEGFLQLLDRNQKVIYHQDFEDNGDIPKVEINSISDLDAEEYDIGPPDRSVSKFTQYSSSRKKRMGPVTKKEYEMVIQLHNCLGHMNPAKMSQAIREGAWYGVEISPTSMDRVFLHYDCEACALGRRPETPRGSQVKSVIVGETLSFDFVPLAINGCIFIGYYCVVCVATGFIHIIIVKSLNATAAYIKRSYYIVNGASDQGS